MNGYVIVLLLIIVIVLIFRMFLLNRQIRSMWQQLEIRLEEKTSQPLSIQLLNNELNRLTTGINQCLENGAHAVIRSARKEKEFKEMVASISHDLRTPLTVIKGNLQLLEQDFMMDEQRQKLTVIKRHTEDMAQLVERFWEYSYYSAADRELKFEKINLTNLVVECVSDYVSQIESKGFSASCHQEKPVYVYADREYCLRISQNLIRNCINHSGGNIEIEIQQNGDKVLLEVKNPVTNNLEIDIERIFDSFYTADKSRKKMSGLGLSIVALLVGKIGGTVAASLQGKCLSIQVGFRAWTDM